MVANATRSLAGKTGVAVIITYVWDESIMDHAYLQSRNSADLRARILENFGYLGLEIDEAKNKENAAVFSTPSSEVYAMTIRTNEELVIARETYRILTRSKS